MAPRPELRQVDEASYDGFARNLDRTFGFDYNPDEDTFRPLIEFERAFAHFDQGTVVSTLGAFSLEMTVPGAVLPCGGTTVVAVAPTHRRRGLLTELMTTHLAEVRDRGESFAALWASESEIYGRYGYGRATKSADITIKRQAPTLSRHAPEPLPVRMIDPEEAKEKVPTFHDRFRTGQPGMFKRSEPWWEHRTFSDLPSRRSGYTAARWAVVDDRDGGIQGYARYRTKGVPGDSHPASEMVVWELFASSPEAWAGLWWYLLNHDLVVEVTARLRPSEDPIFDLLAGPRRAQLKVTDGLWVRLIDIPEALEARSYQSEFHGVIEVHDPMGLSGGSYELVASPEGAQCRSTDKDGDIILDIEDLGSIYLGQPGLRRMARVGRLSGDEKSLEAADLAFGWSPQPWCPEVF